MPQKKYTFEQKWGDDPFTAEGYAQIPVALFKFGARLLIEPDEGYLICHIWQFKWSPSDEGPSEARLAENFGKSDDTVRKLLKRLVAKGYLKLTRMRGEMGYYTHTIYDFRQLRAFLNECYYQDHPEHRPKGKRPLKLPEKPATTAQLRGVVKRQQVPRESAPGFPAKEGVASPQPRGESLESENIKISEGSLALFSETESDLPKTCAMALKLDAMTLPPSKFDADWMRKRLTREALRPQIDADPRILPALRRNWDKLPEYIRINVESIVSTEANV